MTRSYSPMTREAARLLGTQITLARKERQMTLAELATRVGTTLPTLRKIERGDPSVTLGLAFEAAAALGIPLFDQDPAARGREAARLRAHLALLPTRIRRGRVDDDF